MAFLDRKIRGTYAAALGALGFALGAAIDPVSAQSEQDRAAAAPISLRSARASVERQADPKTTSSQGPAKRVTITVPVERKIEGKPIEWWRARAVANRHTINRLSSAASNQSNNSSSNQSNNSSSNQSNNASSSQSSNSSSNQSSNSSS